MSRNVLRCLADLYGTQTAKSSAYKLNLLRMEFGSSILVCPSYSCQYLRACGPVVMFSASARTCLDCVQLSSLGRRSFKVDWTSDTDL